VGVGGITAYDVTTGANLASREKGTPYRALYRLPRGAILGISESNPRLHFFSPGLERIADADTPLTVAAVF
jgi:hypothetical protein